MEYTSLIISIVSAAGVVNYIWWKRQQSHIEQIHNFHKYSLRYQELYSELVSETDVNDPFDYNNPIHRSLAIKFFMLFSEEYYLGEEAKLIRPKVWNIWKSGIQTSMTFEYFKGAWNFATKQSDLSGPFETFIKEVILEDTKNNLSKVS